MKTHFHPLSGSIASLAVVTLSLALPLHFASAADYAPINAGPATGMTAFTARATVSEAGVGAGTAGMHAAQRIVTWGPSGSSSFTTLPTAGYTTNSSTMISDSGIVAGAGNISTTTTVGTTTTTTVSKSVPFIWNNGTATMLSTLEPGTSSLFLANTTAINKTNVVVGFSPIYEPGTSNSLGTRALRWDAGSTSATVLPLASELGNGFGSASARAISNSGWVAGDGQVYGPNNEDRGTQGIIWNSAGALSLTLNPLGYGTDGKGTVEVKGVNNSGVVIGNSFKYANGIDLGRRAVRWEAGTSAPTELGTLGTTLDGKNVDTTAIAVDSAGNIAGLSQKYSATGGALGTRPVVWRAGSTEPLELGILGTASDGIFRGNLSAMNDLGFIAGTVSAFTPQNAPLGRKAVIWNLYGGVFNLNDYIDPLSGWDLQIATDINDAGWIAGIGLYDPTPATTADGGPVQTFFTMKMPNLPVPEPGSALLLCGGLALLLGKRRFYSGAL